jgi:hypothetical protein
MLSQQIGELSGKVAGQRVLDISIEKLGDGVRRITGGYGSWMTSLITLPVELRALKNARLS